MGSVTTDIFIIINPGGPLGLPDSARPGAVRPEEVGKQIIPQSPDTEVLEVPAVIDRPFEIDEGPKVAVVSFRILGARDMPKFDVKIAEIEQLLAKVVADKPEGFTIGQMEETKDVVTQYYRKRGLILAQAVLPVQTVSGRHRRLAGLRRHFGSRHRGR